MDPTRYAQLFEKYRAHLPGLPPDVRRDILLLLEAVHDGQVVAKALREELQGAMQTMLALTRCGSVELSYASIAELDPRDTLKMTDIRDDETGAMYKRFEYEPYKPGEGATIVVPLPRRVH